MQNPSSFTAAKIKFITSYFATCTILIAIAFLTSCKPKTADDKLNPDLVNNPISSVSNSDTSKIPVFKFETENHEFGEIKEGEKVSFSFKFKNIGKTPLVISNATASCGCTVPEYSKDPVKPGDEGHVRVTFNSEGKHGMVSKTVTLLANTIPNTKVLTISADIKQIE
jgi:hypothetical protein